MARGPGGGCGHGQEARGPAGAKERLPRRLAQVLCKDDGVVRERVGKLRVEGKGEGQHGGGGGGGPQLVRPGEVWRQQRLLRGGQVRVAKHDVGGEARLGAIAVDDPNARRSSAALARLPALLGDLDSRDGHAGSHPHADLLALLEQPPPHAPEPAPRIANAVRRGVQLHRLQQREDGGRLVWRQADVQVLEGEQGADLVRGWEVAVELLHVRLAHG
mmetsp:Transcript_42076/g.138489  ORF Transcript_42076/g.138489 Transcript_42076/m.138489 type:complete len:217 (+) Transcript_42076:646-1296(+)